MNKKCVMFLILILMFFTSFSAFPAGNAKKHPYIIYYMGKRGGYYAIFRGSGHKEEVLFDSGVLLKSLPNLARYQIPYDVSPDGKYIAFSGLSESRNMDIFLLDVSSRELTNLTKDRYVNTLPVFSHDSRYVAYLSHERGGRYYQNLFIVSTDGRIKKRITKDYFKIISHSFSPDDSKILFVKYLPYHSSISVVNINSGKVEDLTGFESAYRSPSYSNDGSKIVYVSDMMGSFDVWLMNADGSGKRVIFESPGLEYSPRFTPDGTGIYFTSDFVFRGGKAVVGNTVYLINLKTGKVYDLLEKAFADKKIFCFNPDFSSDMKYMCFEGKTLENRKRSTFSIYIMDMRTGRTKKIVSKTSNVSEPRFAK